MAAPPGRWASSVAGAAIQPCGQTADPFAPTPVTPTRLTSVRAPAGLPGRPGQTLVAVLDTLVDLDRQVIGATLQAGELPSGARFGGLRGGYARVSATALALHHFSFVAGVELTGTFPISDRRAAGRERRHLRQRRRSTAPSASTRISSGRAARSAAGTFSVLISSAMLSRRGAAGWPSAGRLAWLADGSARTPGHSRPAPGYAESVSNALARETSPYLRQHAENPVQWLPWGEEALALARSQEKPLLVSIGYSACHWCHVMERESFEDPRTAALMNESFVCVKVDREERPDIDALYMEAVQGMTGGGGWPLNVFLTPEQVPFYGGTYFPPEPRHGMPAWTQVLAAVAESWRESSAEIRAGGEAVRERLGGAARLEPSREPLQEDALERAVATLAGEFDARNGGFGGAPKFPHASVIEFLLLRGERAMPLSTLHAMASGGIHDVLAGGFARYSVERDVDRPPLREDALRQRPPRTRLSPRLAGLRRRRLREVAIATLAWALAEMRGPEGAFFSSLDADSEGVEGRFYVWRAEELEDVLGADAGAAIAWLGVTERGNFVDVQHPLPGLNVSRTAARRPSRRTRRAHPLAPAESPRKAPPPGTRRQAIGGLEHAHGSAPLPTPAPGARRARATWRRRLAAQRLRRSADARPGRPPASQLQ